MKENRRAKDSELVVPPPGKVEDWVDLPDVKLFRGIGGVKAANDTQFVTPEQAKYYVEEIKRCKEDIVHFAENWFYIISYRGKEKIKLYPKQKEIIETFNRNPFSIVLSGRQQGKCFCYAGGIVVRNKKTGEIKSIPIGEFFSEMAST